jgi:hypothetical protein
MKTLFKYSYIALFGVLALLVSSCTNDYNYDPATVQGEQVYFSNALASQIEISSTANSFTVPVNRIQKTDAITVPITVTMGDGSIYSVTNKQVSFNAGDSVAYVTVSYDPKNIVYGTYTDITLQIGDQNYTTVYGKSSYSFKAGVTAWVAMKGAASYREDCMTTFFNVKNVVYDVAIEKNIIKNGVYRLKNPYGSTYPYSSGFNYDKSKDYYMELDASDPNFVYVTGGEMGIDDGTDGMTSITSLVAYNLAKGASLDKIKASKPGWFGTLKDGIITMPAKSLLISLAKYNGGGYYYANGNGMFAVALPGYKIADYSLTYATSGTFIDTNTNEFTYGTLTFGADVASVKWALASSADDIEKVYNGIVDGSVESTEQKGSGDIHIPMPGTGTYYLVIVLYDSEGNVVGNDVEEIKFKSTKDTVEKWKAIYNGVYAYTAKDYSKAQAGGIYEGTYEGVMYQSESDATRFKIVPWAGTKSEGLIFTWDTATNNLVVDGVSTGDDLTQSGTDYGLIYASDFVTANVANIPSVYDPATKTFSFYLAYHISAGNLAYVMDTFTISSAAAKKMAKAAAKKTSSKRTNTKFTIRASKRIKDYAYIYKMN